MTVRPDAIPVHASTVATILKNFPAWAKWSGRSNVYYARDWNRPDRYQGLRGAEAPHRYERSGVE